MGKKQAAKNTGQHIANDFGQPRAFALNLLADKIISDTDFHTFLQVHYAAHIDPGLVIYLNGLERAWEDMQKRGRDCEKGVPFSYQEGLHNNYEKALKCMEERGVKVERLNWSTGGDLAALREVLGDHGFPNRIDEEYFYRLIEEKKIG